MDALQALWSEAGLVDIKIQAREIVVTRDFAEFNILVDGFTAAKHRTSSCCDVSS